MSGKLDIANLKQQTLTHKVFLEMDPRQLQPPKSTPSTQPTQSTQSSVSNIEIHKKPRQPKKDQIRELIRQNNTNEVVLPEQPRKISVIDPSTRPQYWDKIQCSVCDKIYSRSGKTNHYRSTYHQLFQKFDIPR
jgi:hypothetical protein